MYTLATGRQENNSMLQQAYMYLVTFYVCQGQK